DHCQQWAVDLLCSSFQAGKGWIRMSCRIVVEAELKKLTSQLGHRVWVVAGQPARIEGGIKPGLHVDRDATRLQRVIWKQATPRKDLRPKDVVVPDFPIFVSSLCAGIALAWLESRSKHSHHALVLIVA